MKVKNIDEIAINVALHLRHAAMLRNLLASLPRVEHCFEENIKQAAKTYENLAIQAEELLTDAADVITDLMLLHNRRIVKGD